MQLSNKDLKIEFFSDTLELIERQYGFQLNGATISPQQFILEFQTCIDDEDIVFDVYYDQDYRFKKIHVDEDYERSFHQHFNDNQFKNAELKRQ